MDVEKKELEGNKVELDVRVNSEKVDEALDKAYRKVVKDVNIPGFRKGKVPRKVLEARFGKEILHQDALEFLIPEAYMQVVEETEIKPIAQPEIEDFYLEESEPATFKAIVEVRPEVELGQYTDLGIEKEEVEVTEDEIMAHLQRLQEQYSQLENTDKEEVENGDHVNIDFEGKLDGTPFPGGSAEEYSLEIGSQSFIPGFEEKLIGCKVGEQIEFDITFPEDYQNAPDLAGESVTFTVDIKEIKKKTKPDLDDDFAREASDFDTLGELKEDIKDNLLAQKEQQARQEYEKELINTVAENAKLEISDTLIEQELDRMYQNISYKISSQGMKMEDFLQYKGLNEESWREQNREAAAIRVRNDLVLREIMKKEEIEVSDEDIDEYFAEIAENSDEDPQELKEQFTANNQLNYIKDNIKMEKTFDFLAKNN